MKNLTIWKVLTNIWTLITLFYFILEFFSKGQYQITRGGIAIIYVSILSIYVGTKEFSRWRLVHERSYRGEWFVIVWTIVTVSLAVIAPFSKDYKLPNEFIATYIAVLGLFAISRRSKLLHSYKKGKKKKRS